MIDLCEQRCGTRIWARWPAWWRRWPAWDRWKPSEVPEWTTARPRPSPTSRWRRTTTRRIRGRPTMKLPLPMPFTWPKKTSSPKPSTLWPKYDDYETIVRIFLNNEMFAWRFDAEPERRKLVECRGRRRRR